MARELLGETFKGILVTDRYSAYNWYAVRWRQLCWAHLLRDIEAMIGRGGCSQEIGKSLRSHVHQMFHWWHRVRDGTLRRSSFRSYMSPLRCEVERLLEVGSRCGVPKTEGVCRNILKRRQALWTFVHLAGVEPTNNAAEVAIRPGVLWRKGSVGTHSAQGSRFVEAMMTVVATLKQQQQFPGAGGISFSEGSAACLFVTLYATMKPLTTFYLFPIGGLGPDSCHLFFFP